VCSVRVGYRAVPVITVSTSRLFHREQTSRSRQSRTEVSAPYPAAIGLDLMLACLAPDDKPDFDNASPERHRGATKEVS
jgi:hypothetical protein